jgi:hypothetical protein
MQKAGVNFLLNGNSGEEIVSSPYKLRQLGKTSTSQITNHEEMANE